MFSNRKYPMCPPPGLCSILTIYKLEHHENRIAVHKALEAIDYAERIFAGFDNEERCLGAIILLLSDVPEEPLLSADQARKASVLGLTSLGFVIHHKTYGEAARRVVLKGDGVIVLQVTGDYQAAQYEVEVFEGRVAYAEHLTRFSESGGAPTANSTLL